METVTDFILGGSKITADGDCSYEIKRRLLLGRKVMTNLDSILKNRDITLPTKVHLVKAMVFPVVMYGWEGWTVKKAECWGIDAFELWCWRRLLRVSWTARRSNQSILKEISPEYSLEGLILKLKLQLSGKDPDAGKDWRWKEKGAADDETVGWHHWPDGRESEWTPGVVMEREAWRAAIHGSQRVGHDWATKLNWTELNWVSIVCMYVEGNGTPLQYSCLENPRDAEPGGLPSMGSHRVRHDWGDLAAAVSVVCM